MSEELNKELYESLCTSVLKWFETDRGYDVEISIDKSLAFSKSLSNIE